MATRSPETQLEPVDALLERGRWYAARKAIKGILQNHPTDVETRALAIQIDAFLTPMVGARGRLQAAALELIEAAPNLAFPRLVNALIARLRGFRRLALEWALQIESWFPQDRRATRYAASALSEAGLTAEAWSRYRSLMRAGAHLPPAHRTNAFWSAWKAGDRGGARQIRAAAPPLLRLALWPPWVHMIFGGLPIALAISGLVTGLEGFLLASAALLAFMVVVAQIRCPDLRITSALRSLAGFGLPLSAFILREDPLSDRLILAGFLVATLVGAIVVRSRLQKRTTSAIELGPEGVAP